MPKNKNNDYLGPCELSPLEDAIVRNDNEAVKAIVDCSVDLRHGGVAGISCLDLAVSAKNADAVKIIAESKAGKTLINTPDEIGVIPLFYAVHGNDEVITALLVEAGSDIHWKDGLGNCVIHEAAEKASLSMIKILLDAGADPLAPGWQNENAIDKARERYRVDPSIENREIQKLMFSYARRMTGSDADVDDEKIAMDSWLKNHA